jgi:hypothetical protein
MVVLQSFSQGNATQDIMDHDPGHGIGITSPDTLPDPLADQPATGHLYSER